MMIGGENLNIEVNKFQPNDRVIVVSSCNSYGDMGTVVKYHAFPSNYTKYVGVRLDDSCYKQFNENSLEKINISKEEYKMILGNYKIAIVNLNEDYNKKDYGFAIFDEAKVGDTVVVNPLNRLTLGVIKDIKTQEEYRKEVTKEVVSVVNMEEYHKRVEARNRAIELEKQRKEIKKQLDEKISKLKTLEFYERMANELGSLDPEICSLVEKLKDIVTHSRDFSHE